MMQTNTKLEHKSFPTVINHAGVSRAFSRVCLFVCLSVCLRSNRKKAWAINTKLGTRILYSSHSAYIDPEVKRSKVKITRSGRTVASDHGRYVVIRYAAVLPAALPAWVCMSIRLPMFSSFVSLDSDVLIAYTTAAAQLAATHTHTTHRKARSTLATMSKQRSTLSKGRNFNAKLVRSTLLPFLATKSNVASTLLLVWTGLKAFGLVNERLAYLSTGSILYFQSATMNLMRIPLMMTTTEPSASPSTCRYTALMFSCAPDSVHKTSNCLYDYETEKAFCVSKQLMSTT